MARKVKLVDTGELIEKSAELYQAPNKKWFSSYDAFLLHDLDDKNRCKCIDKMYELMGYGIKQKINTRFFRVLKEWRDGYDYRTILKAMDMSADAIEYSNRVKKFDNEGAKTNYFLAIIQNKLNDALSLVKLEDKAKKTAEKHDYSSLADGLETVQYMSRNIKGTDVSDLAGDL